MQPLSRRVGAHLHLTAFMLRLAWLGLQCVVAGAASGSIKLFDLDQGKSECSQPRLGLGLGLGAIMYHAQQPPTPASWAMNHGTTMHGQPEKNRSTSGQPDRWLRLGLGLHQIVAGVCMPSMMDGPAWPCAWQAAVARRCHAHAHAGDGCGAGACQACISAPCAPINAVMRVHVCMHACSDAEPVGSQVQRAARGVQPAWQRASQLLDGHQH